MKPAHPSSLENGFGMTSAKNEKGVWQPGKERSREGREKEKSKWIKEEKNGPVQEKPCLRIKFMAGSCSSFCRLGAQKCLWNVLNHFLLWEEGWQGTSRNKWEIPKHSKYNWHDGLWGCPQSACLPWTLTCPCQCFGHKYLGSGSPSMWRDHNSRFLPDPLILL